MLITDAVACRLTHLQKVQRTRYRITCEMCIAKTPQTTEMETLCRLSIYYTAVIHASHAHKNNWRRETCRPYTYQGSWPRRNDWRRSRRQSTWSTCRPRRRRTHPLRTPSLYHDDVIRQVRESRTAAVCFQQTEGCLFPGKLLTQCYRCFTVDVLKVKTQPSQQNKFVSIPRHIQIYDMTFIIACGMRSRQQREWQ